MSGQQKVLLDDVVIGDRKDIICNIVAAGIDFTAGLVVTAKLRADNGTVVVFTFTPVNTLAAVGSFTTTLTLTGAQTLALGLGGFVGDVVVQATGFGPYTPLQFTFNVIPRISS